VCCPMDDKHSQPSLAATMSKALAQGSFIGLQVGCSAVAVTIGALLLGLWLDGQLHTRPWFTLILLILSMPVTVFLIYRLALRAARSLQTREQQQEKDKSP
jgi:F0F1-type ATP synthase assembly protein I